MQETLRQSGPTLTCPGCSEVVPCRHRDFSPQIWSLLIEWEEVEDTQVGKPMCADCYKDLREVLIERADELQEVTLTSSALVEPALPVVQRERSDVPSNVRKAS